MTTSFPPINYPNKPVPPFTAEPPRNPFPGFFPDMWRNITGKPYITVSSKGLANGLSEYFNDGADFGPDSLQADGSLTTTMGIMEAINSLPKVYNIYTKRDVPVGKVKIMNGQYVITQPIIIYEDWSISIEGEEAPSGNIIPGSQPETTIIGANDIGILLIVTADITGSGADSDVYGGQIYLKNLALLDSYTDASGVYHQYNYSTGYTDLKGHLINYLMFACYSTPDLIILENVEVEYDSANSSDYNSAGFIYTNTAETLVQFRSNVVFVGSTKYHPALTVSSYHFIADTIDMGTNNAPSTYTQYYARFPTFYWSTGPRNFIATLHFGNNDIFPMWAGGGNSFIGTIFFELDQPVLGSNGQPPICGNVTDSLDGMDFGYANFNVSSGACLTVANWNCTQWNPLKSGYLPAPLAGSTLGYTSNAPYLKILQISLSDLGTPFNPSPGSNTGWSCQSTSSPLTGSVNYGGIELPANVGYNNYGLSDIPSVPASGTAVQNTNPFTIEVALNGGVVTEIQVTRSGYSSAFTVFSNSSGVALTGQSYRLKPGDSITLTYSTAPSWVWIP